MNGNNEWISVSELAKHLNTSKQTIYNRIRKGMYETQSFQRGAYKGFLIKYNTDYGESKICGGTTTEAKVG